MMFILCLIIAYLLGSISFSMLIGKMVAHLDIREHGSGNAGATNTLRILGLKWAVLVLLLDILKGVVAVLIARGLGHGGLWLSCLAAIAAVLGHNWPIFFGFRGGKGIATTIGVLLLLLPVPTVIAGVIGIIVIALTRYVSLGALALTVLTPIIVAILEPNPVKLLFAIVIAVLSIYRHRTNIRRLLRRQEHRIFSKN